MSVSAARTRRPTVVIAYGESGASWLRRLALTCVTNPELKQLVDSCAIQFWLVGEDGGGRSREAFRRVALDSEAIALRQLIDAGRSERARGANPDLNVREVLVLERWSLFSHDCAPLTSFRGAMRTAQRLGCDPEQTVDDFGYDWVCLADAVREAPTPGDEVLCRARGQVLDRSIRTRTFFIDRVSDGGAIVDADLADECHYHLALAYLDSDIGAPQVEMDIDIVPTEVRAPVEDSELVIPFSVSMLIHRSEEISSGLARALRMACAAGLPNKSEASGFLEANAFRKAFEADRDEIVAGTFQPHVARVRRNEAASAALAWAVATAMEREVELEISEIRRQAKSLAARYTHEQGPALAVLVGLLPKDTIPMAIMMALVLGLCVAGGAYGIRRRRRKAGDQYDDHGFSLASDRARLEEVSTEWAKLCDDLCGLLEAWRDDVGRDQADRASAAIWEQKSPLSWQLGDGVRVTADGAPITPQLYTRLAKDCLSAVQRGEPANAAIDRACRAFMSRYREIGRREGGGFIADALTSATPRFRRSTVQRPFLVRTGAPIVTAAVAWLTSPDLDIGAALRDLETPHTRDVTVVLSHGDPDTSVRIAFGQRQRWQDIVSLSCLSLE